MYHKQIRHTTSIPAESHPSFTLVPHQYFQTDALAPLEATSTLRIAPWLTEAGLAVAQLNSISTIDSCRLPDRHTGLLIRYADGHSDVLGQWYSSYGLKKDIQIERIYDIGTKIGKEVKRIRFTLELFAGEVEVQGTPEKAEKGVTEITFLCDEGEGEGKEEMVNDTCLHITFAFDKGEVSKFCTQ